MKSLQLKFYKMRAIIFIIITKVVAKLFFVEVPPVVSVAAFIEKDGKLLFQSLSYMKGLGLPGGIVKANEDVEAALRREVAEETGMKVISMEYVGSVSVYDKISMLGLFFTVHVDGEVSDSEEGSLMWLDPLEAKGQMAYKSASIALGKFYK